MLGFNRKSFCLIFTAIQIDIFLQTFSDVSVNSIDGLHAISRHRTWTIGMLSLPPRGLSLSVTNAVMSGTGKR